MAEKSDPTLVEIRRLPEERAFRLTWSDGFRAQPSWRYLAGYCPCAGCQGHGGRVEFHEPAPEIEPESVQPVGHYAVSIVWRRGCRTGIYTFDYLRRLCSAEPPAREGATLSGERRG